MTATVGPPAREERGESSQTPPLTALEGPRLTSPCCGARLSSCPPTGPPLGWKVVGVPSEGWAFQRCHSIDSPSAKFSHSRFVNANDRDPSAWLGYNNNNNNKQDHVGECFFSELADRPWPGRPVNSIRYKTELCRPFEESGGCKYGDKCQFAHGEREQRGLSRHPKYKTEPCRTFHRAGFCPYGPRCHFIHNAEERRGPPLRHGFGFPCHASGTPPPCVGPPAGSEPQDLAPPSSPPAAAEPPPGPPDAVSEREGDRSSQSGSSSPLLEASRRLPIFSRLSVSDD
ncbi:Zinc finger protein 36, C3H1 type-like 1 [Liparis tanakae]|uniref:mRNA decay activator protein ZFP36 n=1 Tax=Liparis tanakae TaxID=230148 RepID=A0A4Z2F3X0_9TELE|nr:Zinc finger protein 36, C3H1 type-like 1 [Liparis tanakae]